MKMGCVEPLEETKGLPSQAARFTELGRSLGTSRVSERRKEILAYLRRSSCSAFTQLRETLNGAQRRERKFRCRWKPRKQKFPGTFRAVASMTQLFGDVVPSADSRMNTEPMVNVRGEYIARQSLSWHGMKGKKGGGGGEFFFL